MDVLYDYTSVHLLTLFFIVLKVTHVIDWDWWIVALPSIGAVCMYIIGFIIDR